MAVEQRGATLVDVTRPAINARIWDGLWILAFSGLVALLSQVSIPLPFTPVPITGQTLGFLLAGAALGSRRGALAMVLYLTEGVAGLPVFALGLSGLAVILGPTGGYLLAAPLAAFATGWLAERGWERTLPQAVVALLPGEILIYALGLPWLAHFVGASRAVPLGLLPFIPGDIIKLLLAAAVLPSAWALLRLTGSGGFSRRP